MIVDLFEVKLSAVRALLGHVTPNLRAVCVASDENLISAIFYYDGEISEDEFELFEQAKDEIIADFCQPMGPLKEELEFELDSIRVDHPQNMPLKGAWVYYRHEL